MIYEEILKKFTVMTRRGDSAQCTCPCHDDKRASLTVSKGEAGRTVLFCHAGCRTDAVLSAVGLKQADLFADGGPGGNRVPDDAWRRYVEGREKKKLEAAYHYTALDGSYAFTRLRLAGKKFVYGILDGGRFSYGLKGKRRKELPAIFGDLGSFRKAVTEGRTVFYAEGEKDVLTLQQHGFPALTTGGASDWTPECAALFKGAHLVVLRDNDAPGRRLAEKVAADTRHAGATSVKIVCPMPDLPHGDASDFLAAHSVAELEALVENTWEQEATHSESGTPDLSQFHRLNAKGEPVGVFDVRIFEFLKETIPMFVMGREIFVYEHGVFCRDASGAKLKTRIRNLLYPEFVRASTIERVFLLFLQDAALQKNFEELNQYPSSWINFKNGFYDAAAQKMVPHGPDYMAINQVPHEFDPDAAPECGKLEAWLSSICGADEREMLLQYAGLCLTRDTRQQRLLVLCGAAGSGKSTLIRLIERAVGAENTSSVSLCELPQRFATADLAGMLLNSCADLELSALEDAAVLKKLLGEDSIRAERKGLPAFTFRNYAKLVFSANEMPIVRSEKTSAVYRRLVILEMNKVPDAARPGFFEEELLPELGGFVSLAVSALTRMYNRNTLFEAQSSRDAVERLRARSDSVVAFLAEACERDPDARTSRAEAFAEYERYCSENERKPLTKSNLYESLRLKGFSEAKLHGVWGFRGLRIAPKNAPSGFDNCPQSEIPF